MLCAVTDYSTMEFVEYEDVFNYLQGGSYPAEPREALGGSQKSLEVMMAFFTTLMVAERGSGSKMRVQRRES